MAISAMSSQLERLLRIELDLSTMRKLGVEEGTILLVMDFEEKYREDFIERILKGQSIPLALSVCIDLIYLEKLAEKDYEIESLKAKIELLHSDVDVYESRIEELIKTQVVNNITNVYNVMNENKPSWTCGGNATTGDVVWDSYILGVDKESNQ